MMGERIMRTDGVKLSKKDRQRIKTDASRPLRVIESLDFSRIYEDVPVEVLEGYTVTDSDTYECFAVFKIQNTGEKDISALDVRLLLYEGTANIPTRKINFSYQAAHGFFGKRTLNVENKAVKLPRIRLKRELLPPYIRHGECFGEGIYIPLPKSYCRKIEFEIRTVRFSDGTEQVVNVVSGRKYKFFKELDEDIRYAYSKINVFARAEETHPIKIIPQATSTAWLCCCGNKNLITDAVCSACGREKDWQLSNITENTLSTELDRIRSIADPVYIHLHKAKAGKPLTVESDEERKKKAAAFERSLQMVAEQEKIKERKKKMIIPKLVLWAAVIYLMIFILQTIVDHQM